MGKRQRPVTERVVVRAAHSDLYVNVVAANAGIPDAQLGFFRPIATVHLTALGVRRGYLVKAMPFVEILDRQER